MKKLVLILLFFGCSNKPEVIQQVDIKIGINGLGITKHSFARTVDDWLHVLSPNDAEIRVIDHTSNTTKIFNHPFNQLNTFLLSLWVGSEYEIKIYPYAFDRQYLHFTGTSEQLLIDENTFEFPVDITSNQCLVLLDSDFSCSPPKITSGNLNDDLFLTDGFYYTYLQETPDTLQYSFSLCSTVKGNGTLNLRGAQRETLYYIDLEGGGTVNLNLGVDNLFSNIIVK